MSTVSCATLPVLDAINPLKPERGIDATLQVGKENHTTKNKTLAQLESTTTTSNDNKAEIINQNYENLPPWILLLIVGLAGIAIPNPFDRNRRKFIQWSEQVIDERLSKNE